MSTGKNMNIEWDGGEKDNSNLLLTEIFPSVHETFKSIIFSDNKISDPTQVWFPNDL